MAQAPRLVFFFKGRMNVRVNITSNRGIYWICKRIWFYGRVYMPTTLPNDPLCIHAMQICHRIVRSCWLSGTPICWTREHIICSWYQNIVTRGVKKKEKGFPQVGLSLPGQIQIQQTVPFQPYSELLSDLIPNFQITQNRHTPLALAMNPCT